MPSTSMLPLLRWDALGCTAAAQRAALQAAAPGIPAAPAPAARRPPPLLLQVGGEDDESSSDEDDEMEEDEEAPAGQAMQQAPKEPVGPVVDEDGFELVQKRKGKR